MNTTETHNKQVHEWRAKRKAQLDATPRCTFCDHRGTWKCGAGEPVLLCGWCFRKAKRLTSGPGLLACFHTWTGADLRVILEHAHKKTA